MELFSIRIQRTFQLVSTEEAGCFAAAMSTLKLEASGPFSKTEEDVWNIIRTSSLKAEKI